MSKPKINKKIKQAGKKNQVRGRGGIQYTNTTHRLQHTHSSQNTRDKKKKDREHDRQRRILLQDQSFHEERDKRRKSLSKQ
jgi:hypothetical protein